MNGSVLFYLPIFLLIWCPLIAQTNWPSHATNGTGQTVLSPILLQRMEAKSLENTFDILVMAQDTAAFKRFMEFSLASLESDNHQYSSPIFIIRKINKDQLVLLAASGTAAQIELARIPFEESALKNHDPTLNRVQNLQHKYPQLTGEGFTASVKEEQFDTSDLDLKNRHLISAYSSSNSSQHATIMATILGGAGNSDPSGRGVAPSSRLSSSDFTNLLPEPDDYFTTQNISVQNHSYGTGIENYYGIETLAFDEQCRAFPQLLHVFSAGNAGDQAAGLGQYSGISGFANLTGQFKMSKNTISVGATDSVGMVLPYSSRGPAYDGRIKPEVVAFGLSGSSGSAALVSGIAVLVQQAFEQNHPGQLPPSALVKAILINTARDVGAPSLDFETGFGNVDATKAVQTIFRENFVLDTVSQGEIFEMPFQIPPGIAQAKITLAWTDPAAEVNAAKALVNDIDLELGNPTTIETWLPWTLNAFPHPDSLRLIAKRGKDSLNNVEQITLANPVPGDYSLRVKATNLAIGPQSFSLTWQLDSLNQFEWTFPNENDFMNAAKPGMVRWQSTLSSPSATFSYYYIGENWQPIVGGIDLTNAYFRWTPPAQTGLAQLRMEAGTEVFVSDTFFIASQLRPKVGFDCPDSLMIFWNALPAAESYQVFRMGERYLEPLAETTDTIFILDAISKTVKHLAVAPVIGNKTGPLSSTFDYSKQGVACYLKNFLFQEPILVV